MEKQSLATRVRALARRSPEGYDKRQLLAIAAELERLREHVTDNAAWELPGAQRALRSALAAALADRKEGV